MAVTRDKTFGREIIYLPDTLSQQDIREGKLKAWLWKQKNASSLSDAMFNEIYARIEPDALAMAAEREFLLKLKENLASDSWPKEKRWNTKAGFSTWSGIKVENKRVSNTKIYAKRIVEIDLSRHYLSGHRESGRSGKIPDTLGVLTYLRKLNLCYNFIVGEIPSSIKRLTKLTEIRLEFNHLTGNLPSGLSAFTNLKKLSIDHNKIEGNINELANLPNIEFLNIHRNLFSGMVPESMADKTSLTHFWFYENQLSVGPNVKKRVQKSDEWKDEE